MMNIIKWWVAFRCPLLLSRNYESSDRGNLFSRRTAYGFRSVSQLKKVLHDRNLSTAVGDEGGFAPALSGTEDALNSIIEAIRKAGYKPGRAEDGGDISIGLDCAASEFYENGIYNYAKFEGANGVKKNKQTAG